jgi:hypothetical protein
LNEARIDDVDYDVVDDVYGDDKGVGDVSHKVTFSFLSADADKKVEKRANNNLIFRVSFFCLFQTKVNNVKGVRG